MTELIDDKLLSMRFIADDRGMTPRGVRNQIARGVFPQPDLNIGGLNFWRASTYRAWKARAVAGEFAAVRDPRRNSRAPEAA